MSAASTTARKRRSSLVWRAALVSLGVLVVALVPAGAGSATSGLVAAYGFEEGHGATVADSSGNGNDGTLANATRTHFGVYGSGLLLDGSGAGVVVADSPSLDLRQSMTLEAWVKPTRVSAAWRDVIYKGDDSYFLEATSTSHAAPAGGGKFASGDSSAVFGTAALSREKWAYLAVTFDRSKLRLYVDGKEVARVSEKHVLKPSTRPLEIGGDSIYGRYFKGKIDEVRVYRVARTRDEIRRDMHTPVVAGTSGDTAPPSAPGTLSAAAAGSGEVDLGWGAASDNVGVTGYEVFRCRGEGCSDYARVAQVGGGSTSYQDTSVDASSSYSYEVRAVDAAANTGAFSNVASATTPAAPDTAPPSAPSDLTTSAVAQNSMTLSWSAASDNVSVTGYRVYLNDNQVDTTTTTSYLYGKLACGTSYMLGVSATDAAGNASSVATLTRQTASCSDTTPPSSPGSLTASAKSSSEIDLSWIAASDNVGVTGYEIWRCKTNGCSDFMQVASTPTTSLSDIGLDPATSYSYEVRALDAAGNTSPYSNIASATTLPNSSPGPGPLHVDPSRRYLVDQNGTPFLMTGDSPHSLIGNLTEADAELYFSTRHAQGFNTVWVELLCNNYTGCNSDGSTWDGIPPFLTPGDLSTPNDAYFARVDKMIQLAAQYGFIVLLDPAETGGWLNTLIDNGVDKDRAYGQYLGRRYSAFSNIIWMSGNDYQSWGPDNDPFVTAVAQGIRDANPSALQTVELNYLTSGSLDDPAWAPLIDLNASYTYDPTYIQVLKDYNRANFLPTFLGEASYEDEQNYQTPAGTPKQLRRQEYWSLLSGATGQLYGDHFIWPFLCSQHDTDGNCIGGWKDQLASTGAKQMANLLGLFSSRRWYELVPDQNHAFVTSGFGTFGNDDYVTAARTPDGKLAIAYMPTPGTLTLDLSSLSGPISARWYDPTNGTYTTIDNSPLPNSGSISVAPPGANAQGDGDWVLILEAS